MADCVSVSYTSVGCNCTPHALDWGYNGVICFAASHAVAIYEPKSANKLGKPLQMAHEHRGRVNCVRWISNPTLPAQETEFLSGSTDKVVKLWSYEDEGKVICLCTLTELNASINSVYGIYWEYDNATSAVIVATGANQVCIWMRHGKNNDKIRLMKKFSTGNVMMLDCKIQLLPGCGVPLIAVAGDDGNIHVFNFELEKDDLSCVKSAFQISGHEDWVRCLAFTVDDSGDLLLASAAQDVLIRVWRISQRDTIHMHSVNSSSKRDPKLQLHSTQGEFSLYMKKELKFSCQLETVLQGHENWVYGLHWQHPTILEGGKLTNPLQLLSCSMDKTMIIWGVETSNGVWLDRVRVGEVGGNTLGLYGCRFGPNGDSILAHGYQGALHLWHQLQSGEWKPGVACGGHFGSVEDFIWDQKGEYAISVSADQTTRFHAQWIPSPSMPNEAHSEATWHELGRPQVHGYDLTCIASLGRFRFASGAEEKVIRIFQAPRNFLENLARISGIDVGALLDNSSPQGAAVPALGLSNKPVYQTDEENREEDGKAKANSRSDLYAENYFTSTHLHAPPTEETLLQNTLWPEVQKLYGHGYELFSMAADRAGKLLVSASRAQQAEHAAILVWNVEERTLVGRLHSHTLTVTQLAFSPDDTKLLSVSRDRTWAVHERDPSSGLTLKTVARGSGGSRILWCCDWSPDSRYFATGSRDKRVIVWESDPTQSTTSYRMSGQPLECNDSVTAVAFCPTLLTPAGVYVLALGLDSGRVNIYSWSSTDSQWSVIAALDQSQAHHLTVKRLKFRPIPVGSSPRTVLLASCGADNTFKIYKLQLPG